MHVTANSKEVRPGSIFFALKGAKHDGHLYIREALERGAVKVFAERDTGIAGVEVLGGGARRRLAEMASEMAGFPSHALKMIGVTGTSGKTTTTYLIQHILETCGIPTARLGTNGGAFQGHEVPTSNTTPDAVTLHNWFAEVKRLGAKAVVMEVSSHALHQDRCWGIAWDSACFLNLSREHMDYHPSLDHYFDAKAMLFNVHADTSRSLGKHPHLHSNRDSPFGQRLIQAHSGVDGYSVSHQIRGLSSHAKGISFEVLLENEWIAASCPLFGSFQVENILAALTCALDFTSGSAGVNGTSAHAACAALERFPGVPGRMESIPNDSGIFVLVDYAHKPEALEKVLLAIQGRPIITVFGCGGDRDRTKRPVMGEIASRLSHHVVLTSDNPRTEDPDAILREIEAGITGQSHQVIPDRREAIRTAIRRAKPGEVVLIAGKGHEDYQIIGTEKRHFDDREEARAALALIRSVQ
jgi:UDP-N-acetylmuramoyl-L-alanyl-D-glutamate--2,6-diaminopimelate ligase